MKNFTVRVPGLLAALLLLARVGEGCDLCGCFLGLTPYDNQSSLTLLHRYRAYHGYSGQSHDLVPTGASFWSAAAPAPAPGQLPAQARIQHAGHAHAPTDFEVYQVDELRARYFLSQRLEMNFFLPWVRNTTFTTEQTVSLRGLGDATVLAGWHLLRRVEVEGSWQHRLIVGLGVKLPTGRSGARDPATDRRYAVSQQLGSGSWDGLAWLTYVGRWRRAGLSTNLSWKYTGRNRFHEAVAPGFSTTASLFYLLPIGADWRLLPAAQLYYERTRGETYYGELTGEHLTNSALLGPALDVFWRNLQLSLAVQRPLFDHGAVDHPQTAGRATLGLTYNFPQTRYLLGSRPAADHSESRLN